MLLLDAGIIRQPKWGHLKDLHKAIKLCEEALIATDPIISSPGPNLEVINNRPMKGLITLCWFKLLNIQRSEWFNLRLQFTRQELYAPPSLPTPVQPTQR